MYIVSSVIHQHIYMYIVRCLAHTRQTGARKASVLTPWPSGQKKAIRAGRTALANAFGRCMVMSKDKKHLCCVEASQFRRIEQAWHPTLGP